MNATTENRRDRANGFLWLSAFVLFAMLLVQAGRTPVGSNVALASLNDRIGDLTVLTADDGSDQDVLLVLDRVEGMLLVYNVANRQALELLQADPVERLMSQARAAAGSQRSP